MQHLLSLRDATEDFDACEYALSTEVQLRVGSCATACRLHLSPPMFPGPDRKRAIVVRLSRAVPVGPTGSAAMDERGAAGARDAEPGANEEEGHAAGGDTDIHLDEVRAPDLIAFAAAYGIDPEEAIWELAWSVPPHAVTISRGSDSRWPNPWNTTAGAVLSRTGHHE